MLLRSISLMVISNIIAGCFNHSIIESIILITDLRVRCKVLTVASEKYKM